MSIHDERWLTRATLITSTRLLIIPVLIFYILHHAWGAALLCFCYAGITDGIDGYCARRWGEETQFGRYLDPVADKLLIITSCCALAYAGVAIVPSWLWVVLFGKELLLISGAAYLGMYMQRITIQPSWFGKVAMVVQTVFVIYVLCTQWWQNYFMYSSVWIIGMCICVWGALGDYAIQAWYNRTSE